MRGRRRHAPDAARLRGALPRLCGCALHPSDPGRFQRTQLRLQGNAAAERGKLDAAEALYTKALAVGSPRGDHLLLANRSSVRLQQGNKAGALEDALAAQAGGPADWTRGLVREAEARAALGDAAGARAALDRASEIDAFVLKDPDVADTLAAVSEETTFVSIEDDEYDSD